MAESKLYDRSNRSKRAPAYPEPRARPYPSRRFRLKPRQNLLPTPSFDGDETSGDESAEDGESDSEGEDESDDEEEKDENANPFAPSGASGSAAQASISTTTTMPNNPFATGTDVTSTSVSSTGTSTTTTPALTSLELLTATATGAASSSNGSSVSSSGNDHQDNHTTAIALGSVLGVLSVAVAAYLLFRFCTPLKARVAAFRGRRGSKLSGEEDGVPQQLGGGMVQSREFGAMNAFRYSTNAPSSVATPAPSYTRATAIALPITSTRAPAPISIHTGPRDNDPANPFSDYARTLSRNNSNSSARSLQRSVQNSGASNYDNSRPTTDMLNGPGTYPFNFNFDEYRMSGTDIRTTGLTNSTPSAISRSASGSRDNGVSGLGLDMTMSPETPTPVHFSIPYASPSEVATPRTQYMPRIRQSITPSESVSNAPYSPLPFPAGLMPAMPPMDSRWSRNSSSVWTRAVEERISSQSGAAARGASLPPPLPLSVRSSTSSLSSLSSRGSRRKSGRDTEIGTAQGPNQVQNPVLEVPNTRSKKGSIVMGLPSTVRPPSNNDSNITLQPVAYRP